MAQSDSSKQGNFNTLLVVLVAQMGCLTLIIIAVSVLAGIWLDNTFHTRPIFTLVLLLAGVPVSVLLMILVGRKTLDRFKLQATEEATQGKESS